MRKMNFPATNHDNEWMYRLTNTEEKGIQKEREREMNVADGFFWMRANEIYHYLIINQWS